MILIIYLFMPLVKYTSISNYHIFVENSHKLINLNIKMWYVMIIDVGIKERTSFVLKITIKEATN